MKNSRQEAEAKLSKAAQKMLKRLREGKFYVWAKEPPKAMLELQAAGLVGTAGRVETIVRCWVPIHGYKTFTPEQFQDIEE